MKILIVEDDLDKKNAVAEFLVELFSGKLTLLHSESLRSGLRELVTEGPFEVVLLDMSLPNFDISEAEPGGGSPESFAGKEFMEQMQLREISTKVIVITQYSSFERGSVSLDQLRAEFERNYHQFYLGSVYYNGVTDGWKAELKSLLDLVGGVS